MIEINKLTNKDVGRWVWYYPDLMNRELGRIKSWNDKYIFVVYKCSNEWDRYKDYTGCPTSPEDLDFMNIEDTVTLNNKRLKEI